MPGAHWNMWKESVTDYVVDEIAESIIPDSRSTDSFWIQGARELFAESFRFLKESSQEGYKKLLEMTLRIDLKELQKRLKNTVVSTMLDPSIDKTALSIRASLANHLKVFTHLIDAEDGLSLINFMKTNHSDWLFLSCQTDQRSFLKPIFSVWLSLVIKGIMGRQENNGSRTWIIIDELASLNRLPTLMTGLAEIRKYGGCMVLGFQDLSQIEEIYGLANAKTLSNLTGTKVLFRAVDTEVANRVARYMGEQEKEELSTHISYGAHQMRDGVSLNQQRQVKPVLRSSDIMLLVDLESYIKYPGNFSVSKVQFSYLHLPCINEGYVPKLTIKTTEETEEEIEVESHEEHIPEEVFSNVISTRFGAINVKRKAQEIVKQKESELSFDF
jgi:type IV conjugative transfer system coupling protein TraD